jgi:hypothetical protein
MGYYVSSIATLKGDQLHGLFLFFVPARLLQYEWVNGWVYDRFMDLGRRLGPEAVIVAPVDRHGYRDIRDPDAPERGFERVAVLHSGFPFLIVSPTPDALSVGAGALAINLAAFGNEAGVANLFDELIASANSGTPIDPRKLVVPAKTPSDRDQHGDDYSESVMDSLELKPNVFGVGVNINALAHWWLAWRARRAANDEAVRHLE